MFVNNSTYLCRQYVPLKFCNTIFITLIFFCFNLPPSFAHDSLSKKMISINGLPILYHTPETRWAFGIAGIFTFPTTPDSINVKKSSFQIGAAYTQNHQVLFYLPFRLYFQNEKFISFGEFGYYKYNYFFFGIGNNQPPDFSEQYAVNYPRIRLNILRKILYNLYIGVKYWFEDFKITERDINGELIKDYITGSNGGITSGVGVISIRDTRNNIFYPSSGSYAELSVQFFEKTFYSNFKYQRFTLDISKYFHVQKNHIIAFNFFTESIHGNPPFNQMALLGGTKRMRGYYEGRYRDKNILLIQTEYRTHLFWRIGLAGFIGYGGVANQISTYSLNDFKYTYGAGLRFILNKTQRLNLRIDAAFGQNTRGYYLTIGEAF